MKKTIYILLVAAISLMGLTAKAQTTVDSIVTTGTIQVSQTDATPWMKRYQADIDKYVVRRLVFGEFVDSQVGEYLQRPGTASHYSPFVWRFHPARYVV
jgi:hypothetical protein